MTRIAFATTCALVLAAGIHVTICNAQQTDFPTTARSIPLSKEALPWAPEQATGEPDTPQAGDKQTAWASLTPDDQDEWLELSYERPAIPALIRVYETFNPGALTAISISNPDGKWVEVWSGQDPTWPAVPAAISEFPLKVTFPTSRIRLQIASATFPGWNEIDAVALVDPQGKTQWAKSARASSTYADRTSRATATAEPEAAAVETGKAPADATILSHVKDAPQNPDDRRSLGGSGHAIAFDRPADGKQLVAVQIFASRYGMPRPPAEDFHVYILDETRQIVADFPFPYSRISRDQTMRWYTLTVTPTTVPPRFYIALAFNPHQTKGIYLGLDKSVAESQSWAGLPDKGYRPVPEKYDWMIRACFAPVVAK